mgnify:CR=1 FL=1
MKTAQPAYMTTKKERLSYWTYFIGQNVYYNITAAFISTYLAMQGISLAKVAVVLLIVFYRNRAKRRKSCERTVSASGMSGRRRSRASTTFTSASESATERRFTSFRSATPTRRAVTDFFKISTFLPRNTVILFLKPSNLSFTRNIRLI